MPALMPVCPTCPRCNVLHWPNVPCSVAIERAKAAPVDMSFTRSVAEAVPALLKPPKAKPFFRKKNKMTAAARKKLSEKAKAWWANKRAEKTEVENV